MNTLRGTADFDDHSNRHINLEKDQNQEVKISKISLLSKIEIPKIDEKIIILNSANKTISNQFLTIEEELDKHQISCIPKNKQNIDEIEVQETNDLEQEIDNLFSKESENDENAKINDLFEKKAQGSSETSKGVAVKISKVSIKALQTEAESIEFNQTVESFLHRTERALLNVKTFYEDSFPIREVVEEEAVKAGILELLKANLPANNISDREGAKKLLSEKQSYRFVDKVLIRLAKTEIIFERDINGKRIPISREKFQELRANLREQIFEEFCKRGLAINSSQTVENKEEKNEASKKTKESDLYPQKIVEAKDETEQVIIILHVDLSTNNIDLFTKSKEIELICRKIFDEKKQIALEEAYQLKQDLIIIKETYRFELQLEIKDRDKLIQYLVTFTLEQMITKNVAHVSLKGPS